VRGYGQFCPIARGSEVLAERWTPIILRNVLMGCRTFNGIAAGAPGLSRALLTRRLQELQRAGVIDIRPKPEGRGSIYEPTAQGRELWEVLRALGDWAERWMDVTPEQAEPDVVLWSWCESFLRKDRLPDRRVVVRFELTVRTGKRIRTWLLLDRREGEICSFDPGFGDDLVVKIVDPLAFARWHLGLIEWPAALGAGGIEVDGPPELRRALPTWNAGPEVHARLRTEHERVAGSPPRAAPEARDRRSLDRPTDLVPGFRGRLITPDDADYDRARALWNGAIDRRPAVIARCSTPSDVAAAIRFGRERGLPLTVRGGGHGVAGAAVCDDGLVVDFSSMKAISVDPARATATVQAGVRWGELDAVTQAVGLATTGGTMSRTGVAGLTLGGGLGWLMRRHGLTVDNLLSADIVTADGERLTASEHDHPDLLWGLRGGGGGFGAVTSFTYRVHPVGPEVLAGLVLWDLDDAPAVLAAYRDFTASAPPEVAAAIALRRAPQAPFLPPGLHGRPICAVLLAAFGDAALMEERLAALRAFGRPLLDLVRFRPYTDLQSMLDGANPDGWHYYWKSTGLTHLTDDVIAALVEHAAQAQSPASYAVLFHLGGAVAGVDDAATAYSRRTVPFELNVNAVCPPPGHLLASEAAWARRVVSAFGPRAAGVYVNFLDRDDAARLPDAFSPATWRRLVELRRHYDPEGVFTNPALSNETVASRYET